MSWISRQLVRCLLALSMLLVTTSVLSAQRGGLMTDHLHNSTTLGLGYVMSVPNAFVGFSALGISPSILGGAGLYADVKFTHDSPGREAEFRDNIDWQDSEFTYGDRLFEERSAWVMVDLALAYAVTRELVLYAGAGYARERHYRNYFDDSLTRGIEGFYWVLEEEESGERVNIIAGMLIRGAPHFLIQVGADGRPRGAGVGIMLTLPL